MNSDFILDVLSNMHDPKDWAFFRELRIGTGFGKDSETRLDAWAINFFKSKRNTSRCFEVKISRSDFLLEMKKPLKRRPGLRLSQEFYFVTPVGLLTIDEIPPECGLIEISDAGTAKTIIPAPFRDIMPPTWLFTAAIARKADRDRSLEKEKNSQMVAAIAELEGATQRTLDRHIEKWRSVTVGNKEIPEQIARALEDVVREAKKISN